ncbi:MAG: SH3 domain-containing protein [Caldilineaceae bacterium]|nr:SH3 domain-containing protein [Caldilineaceae bacterium]
MRTRIAIAVTFLIAIYLFAFPVSAAPVAQTSIPDFTLNAQTTISVTVAITGGQVIVVPVDLTFIAQNENGSPDISIIAKTEQQAGMYIGIASPSDASASIQRGIVDPIAASAPTPAADEGANASEPLAGGANSYVVNANANLRAGPGTNFEIVGKPRFGDVVIVVGQNNDGSWMELEGGGWIAAFLLDPTTDNRNNGNNNDNNEDETNGTQATPTPPALPTEQPSTGEEPLAAYLLQVAEASTSVSNVAPVLRALLQNPQPFSDQWRNQVTAQITIISAGVDQYLDLAPIRGYENFHTQVTDAAAICEQGTNYLAGGLADPRSFSPTLASDLIESCALQTATLANNAQALQ